MNYKAISKFTKDNQVKLINGECSAREYLVEWAAGEAGRRIVVANKDFADHYNTKFSTGAFEALEEIKEAGGLVYDHEFAMQIAGELSGKLKLANEALNVASGYASHRSVVDLVLEELS